MRLAVTGPEALTILRALRTGPTPKGLPADRTDLMPPDPSPRKRWTRTAIDLGPFSGLVSPGEDRPLHVAVPSKGDRLWMRGVDCTVIERGLPADSFVPVGNGLSIPSPELLFLLMDTYLDPLSQLMLGLELCGSFSRDPVRPLDGDARLGIAPVASAEKIRTFADAATLRGHDQSRELAACLADNAWSPGEALVAAWAALPFLELGYGLGPIQLNDRIAAEGDLATFAAKKSRVPDILLAGTKVGINYDGGGHLDLSKVISAASALGSNPGDSHTSVELNEASRAVRDKYVDDRRRDRELGAAGYQVFVATKEDLYEPGGLDRLMGQCMFALRNAGVEGLGPLIGSLKSRAIVKARQSMLDRVLVGRGESDAVL